MTDMYTMEAISIFQQVWVRKPGMELIIGILSSMKKCCSCNKCFLKSSTEKKRLDGSTFVAFSIIVCSLLFWVYRHTPGSWPVSKKFNTHPIEKISAVFLVTADKLSGAWYPRVPTTVVSETLLFWYSFAPPKSMILICKWFLQISNKDNPIKKLIN